MLRRFNDLPIFDPSRLPGRELIARILGCLAAGALLARMLLQMPAFPGFIREVRWAYPWFARIPRAWRVAPQDLDLSWSSFYTHEQIRWLWSLLLVIWAAEAGLFLWYIVALLTRAPARSVAKGFMQTVFPLLLTVAPALIVMTKDTFAQWSKLHPEELLKALLSLYAALAVGALLNLAALVSLRRAFTVMSEARVLIRSGIYRFIRHPFYASHFLIFLCFTLIHLYPATVGLYVAFVAGQTLRARIEERKLAEIFPEYEDYRRNTGMFFPKLFRRSRISSGARAVSP